MDVFERLHTSHVASDVLSSSTEIIAKPEPFASVFQCIYESMCCGVEQALKRMQIMRKKIWCLKQTAMKDHW